MSLLSVSLYLFAPFLILTWKNGIGRKIGAKIDEFIATGSLKKLDTIHHDPTWQAIQTLTTVMGVGPAAAVDFVKRGITTVERELVEENEMNGELIGWFDRGGLLFLFFGADAGADTLYCDNITTLFT